MNLSVIFSLNIIYDRFGNMVILLNIIKNEILLS